MKVHKITVYAIDGEGLGTEQITDSIENGYCCNGYVSLLTADCQSLDNPEFDLDAEELAQKVALCKLFNEGP